MAISLYPSEDAIRYSEQDNRHFKSEADRNTLYHNALIKYNFSPLSQRIRNRRNVDFKLRLVLQEIVALFELYCPYRTGNGRLNGINYKVINNEADIIVGGLLAPYIVHLGYPLTRRVKPPNRRWMDKVFRRAVVVANSAGYDFIGPDVTYGLAVFTLRPRIGGRYND